MARRPRHRSPRPRGPAVGRGAPRAGRPGRPLRPPSRGRRPARGAALPAGGRRRLEPPRAASWSATSPAFPIADFIAFVHQARLSGVLTVGGDGAERSVAFQEGEVRSAQSSAAGERLGEVAVRLGLRDGGAGRRGAPAGTGPIGKALVDARHPERRTTCGSACTSRSPRSSTPSSSRRTGTSTLVDEAGTSGRAPRSP